MPRKLPFTRFTVKIRTPSLLPKSRPAGSRGESSIIWEQCRSVRISSGVPVNSAANNPQPEAIASPENSPPPTGQLQTGITHQAHMRRTTSAMQQLREPRLQLLIAKEVLRSRRAAVLAASRIAVQQIHCSFQQKLGRRLASDQRKKFDPRALLVVQFDIHKANLTRLGDVSVNRRMLYFALCRPKTGPGTGCLARHPDLHPHHRPIG